MTVIACESVNAQTTSFTYQGKLTDSGNPTTGNYDFQVKLFDLASGGTQQGATQTLTNVAVSGGIFTVQLDFGICATCFNGSSRFLEIAVKPTAGSTFTTLAPRQAISSTPYAIKSLNAGAADGLTLACVNCVTSSQIASVNGSAVNGTIPVASLPAGSGNYIQNTATLQPSSTFNISGNGFIGGKVGIGTTTPQRKFHISDTPPTSTMLLVENTSSAGPLLLANYGSTGEGIYWTGLDSANTAAILTTKPFVLGANGGLIFSGSNGGEHVRITPGGNVGVGTISPVSRLDINQTTPNAFAVNIQTTGVASGSSYGLNVSAGTSTGDSAVQIRNQAGDPLMRIRGDGTVGIGTTNPQAMLSVRSNGITSFEVIDQGNPLFNVGHNGSGDAIVDVLGFLFISKLMTGGMTSLCLDGNHFVATCSSSLRYKKNIEPFQSGLNLIGRLKPITFDWKTGGLHDLGLAAEEVEKIDPLLVTYNKAGQVESVKYDRIGVVLINAVKEQQAEIETQQQQLKRLQEQVNRQDAQARLEHEKFTAQQQQLEALKMLVCRGHRRAVACR
jgi:hypothetical protein